MCSLYTRKGAMLGKGSRLRAHSEVELGYTAMFRQMRDEFQQTEADSITVLFIPLVRKRVI